MADERVVSVKFEQIEQYHGELSEKQTPAQLLGEPGCLGFPRLVGNLLWVES